jgi:hypothetical protein
MISVKAPRMENDGGSFPLFMSAMYMNRIMRCELEVRDQAGKLVN